MNPRWPVFIPSKGRWKQPLTARAFDSIGIPYRIVIQPQQEAEYRAVGLGGEIVLLPEGLDGLVPTRNWIWDLAASEGHERFWTFDDNIRGLWRLHHNRKIRVSDGTPLHVIEQFADRWENLIITGMHYYMFASRKSKMPPLYVNTRVYSNMLIMTDARDPTGQPYRNVGVYNDDTDLCLRVLKDGWPTVLFNAFLIWKMPTMTIKGGMTPLYGKLGESKADDGRLRMAQELRDRHPDVVTVTRKWGRWQHHVDYRPFAGNRLIPKAGVEIKAGTDDFGMRLIQVREEQK